jgi:5'-deoxy-5'-methylthioadenosine phosphorylase
VAGIWAKIAATFSQISVVLMDSDQIRIAIIGGTGFNSLPGFNANNTLYPETPYGPISGALVCGELNGESVAFLNRHGANKHADSHRHIPPHQVNYRANLWALKQLGVCKVVAVNAVGGIRDDLGPAVVAVPDQIIDYSWGRKQSFFDWDDTISASVEPLHVDFNLPFTPELRQQLIEAAKQAGCPVVEQATVAVTQGPRLESIAEVSRLAKDGNDLVGMTNMPEAGLARELGLEYASLAVVVNWAAGRPLVNGQPSNGDIHAEIEKWISQGMKKVEQILLQWLSQSS